MKVSINEITLTNIGDAIREKTGKTDLIAPGNMPAEIRAIQTGGGGDSDGPTPEELTLTGDMSYAFSGGRFEWLIKHYGKAMSTNKIYKTKYMFENTQLEEIPFALNFDSTKGSTNTDCDCSYMFKGMVNLKTVPAMNNFKVHQLAYMFQDCYSLREISNDIFSSWDWSLIDGNTSTSGTAGNMAGIFYTCYSLRKVPMEIFNHGNPLHKTPTYNIYNYAFNCCYALDEIVNLPEPKHASVSNSSSMFNNSFNHCHRLKELTFVPGITLNWSKQSIDLASTPVGYAHTYNVDKMTKYNSGITADKEVKDDATYQALKNDPDWYTTDMAYSRYNHDSAVNTINSLPTVIGGTISFKGDAGSKTDGGAINTLTDAEIAVAAAKGWTVSLV